MLFEWISRVFFFLYATSPVVSLVLLISLFFMKSKEMLIAFSSCILITFLGCTWISPIDAGAWGFGVIEYIFAIPFWFSIGVLLGKYIYYRFSMAEINKIPAFSFLLGFYVLMTLLHFGYAKRASQQSFEIIEGYLLGRVAESDLIKGGHHHRDRFKELVESRLQISHISSQVPEAHIRFLLNQGINIYHCSNTPSDLIDELLKKYEDKKLNYNTHDEIRALCKKPNLWLSDYIRLVKSGSIELGWTMLESPSFNKERCKILRDQLISHLNQTTQNSEENPISIENITAMIKILDEYLKKNKAE